MLCSHKVPLPSKMIITCNIHACTGWTTTMRLTVIACLFMLVFKQRHMFGFDQMACTIKTEPLTLLDFHSKKLKLVKVEDNTESHSDLEVEGESLDEQYRLDQLL